jgi:hypothetical protein
MRSVNSSTGDPSLQHAGGNTGLNCKQVSPLHEKTSELVNSTPSVSAVATPSLREEPSAKRAGGERALPKTDWLANTGSTQLHVRSNASASTCWRTAGDRKNGSAIVDGDDRGAQLQKRLASECATSQKLKAVEEKFSWINSPNRTDAKGRKRKVLPQILPHAIRTTISASTQCACATRIMLLILLVFHAAINGVAVCPRPKAWSAFSTQSSL